MFECSWVEPERETVGQRKERKNQQLNSLSPNSSRRSSASTNKTSTRKIFSLRRRGDNSAKAPEKLFPAQSNDSQPLRRIPSAATTSDLRREPRLATPRTSRENFFLDGPPYSVHGEPKYPQTESILSGRTGGSAATDSTWGSIISTVNKDQFIQPLGHPSFVARTTKATVSFAEGFEASEKTGTFVHIYSDGEFMPGERPAMEEPISPKTSKFPVESVNKPSPSILATHMAIPSNGSMSSREKKANQWIAPDAWKYMPDEPIAPSLPSPDLPAPMRADSQTELAHIQRRFQRMEAATRQTDLEHLKEEWLDVVDALVRRELDLENKLWILTTSQTLNGNKSATGSPPTLDVPKPIGANKVLSLHQNHTFSASLSALALAASTEVHHLAIRPLSPDNHPNIHPLAVPGATAQLPYASSIFSSIHAFSLPALLPSWCIPRMLKECHRCLANNTTSRASPVPFSPTGPADTITGGTLHLTLLDPSPLPSSLGPRLRSWLETHLILRLEEEFRCTSPSRLFLIWLADANLMGKGSTVVTTQFLATAGQDMQNRSSCSSREMSVSGETTITEGLKSRVGRMLWKEMWGSYVKGDEWWWDDGSIIEECERIGTVWEYSIIEAVKQG